MFLLTHVLAVLKRVCLFLMAGWSIAHGADFSTIPTQDGKTIIVLKGEITEGDSAKLKSIIKFANDSGKLVYGIRLHSTGGSLLEGVQLAQTIKYAKMVTSVTAGSYCASACFVVFAAGVEKLVSYSGTVGVHGASDKLGRETPQSNAATISMARILKDLGVPAGIIGKMVVTPPDQIVFLSTDDLRSMGAKMTGRPAQVRSGEESGPPMQFPPSAKATTAPGEHLSSGAFNAKKARIDLVSEFVRELEVLYQFQETAKREFAEDSSANGKLATGIRMGTRTVFEMNDSIGRLGRIAVTDDWAKFRDLLREAHRQRIATVQEMTEISKAMLSGPEPGINYGAMSARAPELTAKIEQIDKTMFSMAQALFFSLVDEARVGPDGNLHHLILTKKERLSMVGLIDKIFGRGLEDKDATSIVSAAWVIKYGLTRPTYKGADEI